jgi:class 3 adenylate cyclase/tetratricopeptide (TPR) repeat protein
MEIAAMVCAVCGGQLIAHFRFCPACGAAVQRPDSERRKLATVLFCDLVESTALAERHDSEVVRELYGEYFAAMRKVLERHGGTIEKFVGDAILAVFGIPATREDDAVRAARAACEMQIELARLNESLERRFGQRLEARIGLNSGEVLATATSVELIAAGDTVNVAARLQQAAGAGEVLLGAETYELIEKSATAVPIDPVVAKGKTDPVSAYRLQAVEGGARQGLESRYVGRGTELSRLRELLDQACEEGIVVSATVVGEAGLGKSRLVTEFVRQERARASAHVGRCLSYGAGITYWPVVEVARSMIGATVDDSEEFVRARIRSLVDPVVAEQLEELLGISHRSGTAALPIALRQLFEAVAQGAPSIVVVEDVHWAEETLLDLIEHLGRAVTGPILLVCTTRPEMRDGRRPIGEAIQLEPLARNEIVDLIGPTVTSHKIIQRTVELAAGNPLFAEELAAYFNDRVHVSDLPTRLNAVLAARLDALGDLERVVAERAAIEGEVFHAGPLAALVGKPVESALAGLIARRLVTDAAPTFVGERAYRFKHILVREAAYAGIAKRTRARLHEAFAEWLEKRPADVIPELDQVTAFHLETAHALLVELGADRERTAPLARRSFARFAAAGRRAYIRCDAPAAVNLLQRAALLPTSGEPGALEVSVQLGLARALVGDLAGSVAVLDRVIARARAERDDRSLGLGLVSRATNGVFVADREAAFAEATTIFERLGEDALLVVTLAGLWAHYEGKGDRAAAADVSARASRHGIRAWDAPFWTYPSYTAYDMALLLAISTMACGDTPWSEVARRAYDVRDRARATGQLSAVCGMSGQIADAEAGLGRIDACRAAHRAEDVAIGELGLAVPASDPARHLDRGWHEFVGGGDLDVALAHLQRAHDLFHELPDGIPYGMGVHNDDGAMRFALATLLVKLGRYEEARHYAASTSTQPEYEAQLTGVRALLDARDGRSAQAVHDVRDALDAFGGRGYIEIDARLHERLGDVLVLAGCDAEAADEWQLALELFERKQAVSQAQGAAHKLADAAYAVSR